MNYYSKRENSVPNDVDYNTIIIFTLKHIKGGLLMIFLVQLFIEGVNYENI